MSGHVLREQGRVDSSFSMFIFFSVSLLFFLLLFLFFSSSFDSFSAVAASVDFFTSYTPSTGSDRKISERTFASIAFHHIIHFPSQLHVDRLSE